MRPVTEVGCLCSFSFHRESHMPGNIFVEEELSSAYPIQR